ncbi:C25 family cysteine peptidase [Ahniella affigens]|nr:C25 family cysteine peptidase [Ahniella affigens]
MRRFVSCLVCVLAMAATPVWSAVETAVSRDPELGTRTALPNAKFKKRLHRYDEPMRAQQFFNWQRSKDQSFDTDRAIAEARRLAEQMPWFSSARNEVVAGVPNLDQSGTEPNSALDSWTALGPGNVGGRTRTLVFHPNFASNNTMFVGGVAGGIWRTTDGGSTWSPLGDFNPNIAVTAMLIDRTNANHLWVGTGEGFFNVDGVRGAGIFESNDGGTTWTQIQTTAPSASNTNFRYVIDMAQSPNAAATFYVTTLTGLWRTTDSGATWTRYIDPTAGTAANGCHDIIVRPDITPNDTVVVSCGNFAPTGTATGIWQSTNANAVTPTWSKRLGPAGTTVLNRMGRTSLAVAPSNSATMYALIACSAQATSGTTACGDLGGTANDNHFDDGLRAIYRSTDGGATWAAQYTNGFTEATTANRELLLTNPLIGRCGLCTSICGVGATSSYGGQGWYDNVIAVDPANASRVWVGGIDLWRSDDAGVNWGIASYWGQQYMPGVPVTNYAHADQHGIWFPPNYDGSTVKTLFVTNDGGVHRTLDATVAVGTSSTNSQATNSICGQANRPAIAWGNLNNGYQVTQFYHGTVFPNGQTYFGGAQDNGTNLRAESTMSANQWNEVNGGDGGYVAVDPTNTNILYSETTGISIDKSTDGGVNWASAISGITDVGGLFINPFLLDPNLNTRLFTSGRSIWRSANSAGTWTQASSALATRTCGASAFNDNYSAYAVAPGDSNLMVMGSDLGRLCRITNATSSTNATTPVCTTPLGTNCATISSIAFDATQATSTAQNSRVVFATVSDFGFSHVLKSTDGGQTWTAIDNQAGTTARLPDVPAHSLVTDAAYGVGQRLYVGTDLGVFVSIDAGLNWMRENAGFANTPVEWLQMHARTIGTGLAAAKAPATGQLFAFTHGRSLFKTSLRAAGGFCASPAAAIPDNNVGGATSSITLSNISATQTGWIDLDLQMTVTHANVGDLSATLTRTSGAGAPVSVTLFSRPGVPSTSFCTGSGDNIAATFDDDADFTAETRCIDANTPTLAGQFRAEGALSSVLVAGTATYQLTINDQAAGTAGTLNSWCLVPTANTDATVPVTLSALTSERDQQGVLTVRVTTDVQVSVAAFELSSTRREQEVFERAAAGADRTMPDTLQLRAPYSGNQFYLRILNIDGSADTLGPFQVGQHYGRAASNGEAVPIDWPAVRQEQNQIGRSPASVSAGTGVARPAVNLLVADDGIQNVSYEALMTAGATGFADVPLADLALSLEGRQVAVNVRSADTIFNAGDEIEFVGHSLHRPSQTGAAYESLYSRRLPYRLSVDPDHALRVRPARTNDTPTDGPAQVRQQVTVEDNQLYVYSAPLNDPWAWSRTLAMNGSPATTQHQFSLASVDVAAPASIEVSLYGGNDFPLGGLDHHVEVLLNGQLLGETQFDGLQAQTMRFSLPAGSLQANNTLSVRVPGDVGQVYDMVYLEDIQVDYYRTLQATDGQLSFVSETGAGQPVALPQGYLMSDAFEDPVPLCVPEACQTLTITGLQPATARIYQGAGEDWFEIAAVEQSGALRFTAPVSAGHRFEVADASGLKHPEVAAIADTTMLSAGPAEYLVIAHPQFRSALSGLLAARQSDGLSTKLVDVDAVYQQYAGGRVDPQAIDDYVAFAYANLGTRYVLLVGGDTYDYFDDLHLGAISHMPTIYRAGDAFVRFAASDNAFADIDGDLVPELAIGRLPVRTVAELNTQINKILAYQSNHASTLVFGADLSADGVDFDTLVDAHQLAYVGPGSKLSIYPDVSGMPAAKALLVDTINAGARYVEYFGHSSPDRWSYSPMLTASDLNSGALTNINQPIVVNQLGCWNTFFVSPQANGMAHAWLNNTAGAAAVIGATALIEIGSGHELGLRISERLQPGARIGDVLKSAKQDLQADGINAVDVLVVSTLLGDPAMPY